jgi:tetratricopeptide (TPR) repeat protein
LALLLAPLLLIGQVALATPSDLERAQLATQGLIEARNLGAVPQFSQLISEDQFEAAEALSKRYEQAFQKNVAYESPLVKMYGDLGAQDEHLLPHLNKWVETRPSYTSYSARGSYYAYKGFQIRGADFATRTPPEQMTRMHELHALGRQDLNLALTKNAAFVPTYMALLDIERASCNRKDVDALARKAVAAVPSTYYLRSAYMNALQPRRCGSLDEMGNYAKSQAQAADLNPRVWSLQGNVFADQGSQARHDRDYLKAIAYYTKALEYGGRLDFLDARASMYQSLRLYDQAQADLQQMINIDPGDASLRRRMTCLSVMMSGHMCFGS